jgi:membrane protein YdbS with pleckstrin-like domain
MAFPRRLLSDNEELILDLRPHWIALVGPVAVTLVVIVSWVILLGKVDGVPALIVSAAAVMALLGYPVRAFVAWATSHFVVTSERLIHREGLVARSSMEVPLEAINDVRFSQNILERMVGAGDLVIESAGERGQQVFANVRGPEYVQKTIYEMRERNMPRGAGSVGPSAPSMSVELQRLADLRDRGVLTEQEFQTQKARILRGAGN